MMTLAGKIAVVAVLAAAASMGASLANADTPEQQFLNTVHSNGVGGQDDTLLDYAHEWCQFGTLDSHLDSWDALKAEGVPTGGPAGYQAFFVVQTAAARAYCPQKIPTIQPPQRLIPPIFTGL